MKSIFIGDENHLHHLSVGAVCLNQDNEVLVHNYERLQKEGDSRVFENIYTLMRETVENNESLEAALGRGMMEEF